MTLTVHEEEMCHITGDAFRVELLLLISHICHITDILSAENVHRGILFSSSNPEMMKEECGICRNIQVIYYNGIFSKPLKYRNVERIKN